MESIVEYWALIAAILLTAATAGGLWLFYRQIARDKGDRDDRMERALVSARKAAEKTSKVKRPRRWVRARMQLAMLLTQAGGNRPDRERFEEALAIFAEAIPILNTQRLRPELAIALYYKGRAEWGLAGLEAGWEHLEIAVETLRELMAFEPWPRHMLRGVVVGTSAAILIDLGDRKDDLATLEEAAKLARKAVEVARARIRIDKAVAQRNLSHALDMLGRKSVNAAMLEEAIETAHAAIKGIRRNAHPAHWAACHASLGYALGALGELRGDETMLEEALSAMKTARESGEMSWRRDGQVMLARNTAGARLALSRLRNDPAMLRRAIADLADSLASFKELGLPFGQAETARMLGQALAALGEMKGDGDLKEQAADCYRWAQEIYSRAGATRHAVETAEAIRRLENDRLTGASNARNQSLYIVR